MFLIIATYRNIPQDGYSDDLKVEKKDLNDAAFLIRDSIFPGMQGKPDLWIRCYKLYTKGLNAGLDGILICYTYGGEITNPKYREIIKRLKVLLNEAK